MDVSMEAAIVDEIDPLEWFRLAVKQNRSRLCLETVRLMTRAEQAKEYDVLCKIINEFQEEPTTLDPYLETLVRSMTKCLRNVDFTNTRITREDTLLVNEASKLLYTICKVRGRSTVERFLPNEVQDLEYFLSFFVHVMQGSDNTESSVFGWHCRYCLLVIVSFLFFIPFDLEIVLPKAEEGKTESELLLAVLGILKHSLGDPSILRNSASSCLSRLVTRKDMIRTHLLPMVEYCLDSYFSAESSTYRAIGSLNFLRNVFKHASKDELREIGIASRVYERFSELITSAEHEKLSSLHLKGLVKIMEKIALQVLDIDVGEAAEVPEEIEPIMAFVFSSLKSKFSEVRETAARSMGQIGSRLPQELADTMVEYLLEYLAPEEKDTTWQGACHCLAYLALHRLISADLLGSTIEKVIEALHYDVRKGKFSVGSPVRDNACFVCWAMAKVYSPELLKDISTKLSVALLIRATTDREVIIRRSAMAAFQEHVGRNELFDNGIEVLQLCDYYSLGSLKKAYAEIIPALCKFDAYREPLVDELMEKSLVHWDKAIRELAAVSLARIAAERAGWFCSGRLDTIIERSLHPDILVRHGNTLALARIVLEVSKQYVGSVAAAYPSQEQQEKIMGILAMLDTKRLYRGRGGEWVRYNACCLVDAVSQAKYKMPPKMLKAYHSQTDEHLRHLSDEVRDAAAVSLESLMDTFYSPVGNAYKLLITKFCKDLNPNSNASVRRGYAQALGSIPAKFLVAGSPEVANVVKTVVEATRIEDNTELRDPDTRATAIGTLGRLTRRLIGCGSLDETMIAAILASLRTASMDYSVDERGDVGARVRKQVVESYHIVLEALSSHDSELCREEDVLFYTQFLVKQICETLNSLRSAAGKKLEEVVLNATYKEKIWERERLETVVVRPVCNSNIGWEFPEQVFVHMVKLVQSDKYMKYTLSGLMDSLGGISKHVITSSAVAMQHLSSLSEAETTAVQATLTTILRDYVGDDRRFLKFCKALHHLLSNSIFQLVDEKFAQETCEMLHKKLREPGKTVKLVFSIAECFCDFVRFEAVAIDSVPIVMKYLAGNIPRLRWLVSQRLLDSLAGSVPGLDESSQAWAVQELRGTDWLNGEISALSDKTSQLKMKWVDALSSR